MNHKSKIPYHINEHCEYHLLVDNCIMWVIELNFGMCNRNQYIYLLYGIRLAISQKGHTKTTEMNKNKQWSYIGFMLHMLACICYCCCGCTRSAFGMANGNICFFFFKWIEIKIWNSNDFGVLFCFEYKKWGVLVCRNSNCAYFFFFKWNISARQAKKKGVHVIASTFIQYLFILWPNER